MNLSRVQVRQGQEPVSDSEQPQPNMASSIFNPLTQSFWHFSFNKKSIFHFKIRPDICVNLSSFCISVPPLRRKFFTEILSCLFNSFCPPLRLTPALLCTQRQIILKHWWTQVCFYESPRAKPPSSPTTTTTTSSFYPGSGLLVFFFRTLCSLFGRCSCSAQYADCWRESRCNCCQMTFIESDGGETKKKKLDAREKRRKKKDGDGTEGREADGEEGRERSWKKERERKKSHRLPRQPAM